MQLCSASCQQRARQLQALIQTVPSNRSDHQGACISHVDPAQPMTDLLRPLQQLLLLPMLLQPGPP